MKIEDENNALFLLSSLSKSFENFKKVLPCGNECTIILDEVQATVRSNEFSKVRYLKIDVSRESLGVKGCRNLRDFTNQR